MFNALGDQAGKNDTDGFVLAAQSGQSQGRPSITSGSQPIERYFGLPIPAFSRSEPLSRRLGTLGAPPAFQRRLRACGAISLGTDADAWRNATEKNLTVEVLRRACVSQMETVHLCDPTTSDATSACARLGGDVWARPTVGAGGHDVFHVTTAEQLAAARTRYAIHSQDWLLARDALNFNGDGRRHQYRVVVLGERVLRACEHIQDDPDAPCNEGQGAVSRLLAVDDLPADIRRIAASATHALGLPLGGVDLATTGSGGVVVFEVNVHPVISPQRGLEDVAVPYVQAHLALLLDRRYRARPAQTV